jgi:hypothetical protein
MSESQSVRGWEYKTVLFPLGRGWGGLGEVKFDSDAFDAALNRFDSEGWELLSSYIIDNDGTSTQIVAIFKRPRS